MSALGEGFTAQSEPDTRRFADDSAEEIEELVSVLTLPEDRQLPGDRFLDRESSWLDFNARVLELAKDERVPVLERLRFIAIFARNLDEFLMVRVAALHRRVAAGITAKNSAGATPKERLDRISQRAHEFVDEHAKTFCDELLPALAASGIEILRWGDLTADEVTRLRAVFDERIYPVLTPLAVDPAHPFPYISGLSLNLAVVLRDADTGTEHFARLKVPPVLPRFVATNETNTRFLPLEDIIAAHLPQLFSGLEVVETSAFRVTRNEDLEIDNDVENLVHALERELSRRRFGAPVRLEVDCETSDRVLELLVRELGVSPQSVYRIPTPLDLAGLWSIADLDQDGLRYPWFVPSTHPALRSADGTPADVFEAMRSGDILLHHPYDSFSTSVQRFIEQAAGDPWVQAIKLTLYRTSGESPIVDMLIDAARAGKQVLVVVEIKARFDEQANIRWARKLEQAGCHVVYGLVGLKTHCKLVLVVRSDESGGLRRYVHVGTGNYHPKTARIYEDLGLLTTDEAVGADVADLFNHLSGYTRRSGYGTMLVAPDTARSGLERLIEREIDNARKGLPSGISVKVNSLVDEAIIDALYTASRAGVPIDLLVRGMCTIRPGVPGLSETVRVRSILGRFLEHSRVFRFTNSGSPEFLIGSADIMDRNLDRRVEALVEVRDDAAKAELDEILSLAWSAQVDHWWLASDGVWERAAGDGLIDHQETLIARMVGERVDAEAEGELMVREVEDKFRVHSRFHLPDLEQAPALARVSPPRKSTLIATYYDTEDLRLAREGITMRYRHGDGSAGWTLKLPVADARVGVREEITADAGPNDLPDDFRSLVTAYVRSSDLAPRATLRTHRTTYDAHGAEGVLLAEIVDDHVEALKGARSVARFREVEVEDRGGGSTVLDEIGDVLRAAGAVGGEFQPKVVRALGRRATSAPEPPEPGEVRPEDPARAAITALLRRHVRRLIALDVDVRVGATDAVHQMRVTSRRLRAGLREFAELLDPAWSERLQEELRWLAGELAGARDQEVIAERLLDRLAGLPEDLVVGPVAARLTAVLGADAAAAQDAISAALHSKRYVRLLDDLVDAAMHPRTNDRGNQASSEVLPPIMQESWDRLAKRVTRAIAEGDEPAAFHQARIAAKRTRYLAEALAPVFGTPAARLAGEVEKVQEVLGEHQDAVVAGELVRRVAGAPRVGRAAFTLGVLHAQQEREAADARARFTALWPGVAKSKHRRWVKIA